MSKSNLPSAPALTRKDREDVEAVARAIYRAQGWAHWPLDSIDPDSDAHEVCKQYLKMAKAAISEMSSSHASIPASQKGDETLVAENAALLDALTLMWERYEGGVTCHECDEEGNVQEDSSSIGNAVKLTYEEEEQILSLLPKSLTKQAHGNGGTE